MHKCQVGRNTKSQKYVDDSFGICQKDRIKTAHADKMLTNIMAQKKTAKLIKPDHRQCDFCNKTGLGTNRYRHV